MIGETESFSVKVGGVVVEIERSIGEEAVHWEGSGPLEGEVVKLSRVESGEGVRYE